MSGQCKACETPLHGEPVGQKSGYGFLRCPLCHTVVVSPFPTLDQLIAFYQSYKGSCDYRSKAEKKIRRAKGRIARLKRLAKGKIFLDVGCNYGFTVKAALDLGLDARGIDIDSVAVSQSQADYGKDRFTAISVEEYAASGAKADIIYTSEVIEHVHNPSVFVTSIASILNRDGIVYLTTPDAGHWRVPAEFAKWGAARPPEHITYFTRDGISRLLTAHGLEVRRFAFSPLKPGIRLVARKATA